MDPTLEQAAKALFQANPRRDLYVVSHGISRALHYKLSRLVAARKRHDACTLILTTFGGDPNGAYRIARCLRHHYTHLRLVVPSFCKSAGTLIAIAADELAIGDLGELGPLDIQVRKASELEESSSGLDIMQALQAVTLHTQVTFHRMLTESRNLGLSTKLCAEFAGQVVAGVAQPLFAQIDPLRLGEMQRAMRVAFEYGSRLNHDYAHNLKEGALVRLINDYPAHGFVIDRREATELFARVSAPSDEEQAFCEVIWHYVGEQRDEDPVWLDPDQFDNDTGNGDEEPHATDGSGEETGSPSLAALGPIRRRGGNVQDAPGPNEEGVRVRSHDFALTQG